jgi:short-subunit dehydrogenase
MKRYDGKIAVVTGASSGIGRRIALDLAARGAVVVGLARRETLLEEVCAELHKSTQASETFVCDVRDTKQLRSRLAEIEERHGRVDILINDAGVHEATSVSDDASFNACERIMATNYFGVVAGTLAVMPGMLRRADGIIVNVSSDSARAPEAGGGGYAASKAAVSVFTESIAYEVARQGVRVHVLYPAWVPTAMGIGDGDGRLPPKLVRRTETQVSNLVLDRIGGSRVDINASRLPLLAIIGRTLLPRAYARAMERRK